MNLHLHGEVHASIDKLIHPGNGILERALQQSANLRCYRPGRGRLRISMTLAYAATLSPLQVGAAAEQLR